jgi:hypothetical protein
MPVSGYFDGKGEKVLRDMIRRYGEKKGRQVFYATAEAKGKKPPKRREEMLREYARKRSG